RFDDRRLQAPRAVAPGELAAFEDDPLVTWVEVVGLGSLDVLRAVADALSMPALVLEAIVHVPQRSRFEELDEGWFAVLRMDQPVEGFQLRQVAVWVRGNVVALFLEEPTELFEPVRAALSVDGCKLRRGGRDQLVYRIADACVASFFPALEEATRHLEELEDAVLEAPSAAPLRDLYHGRREFRRIHRAGLGLRDATHEMAREGDGLFQAATRPFLWDVHEHAAQIVDLADHSVGIASDIGLLLRDSLNQRMNRAMRAMAVVATVFMPLGFLAAVYGMNFDRASPYNMPELGWRFGYPAALLGMATVAAGMFLWFRRQGWTRDDD
ncbi:MAG TPA: CorA family divalent cation transporter, partial [Planctomycetota bacterium]|nr:CorA family divalent cation transporter [Planctomycetota bacterium]